MGSGTIPDIFESLVVHEAPANTSINDITTRGVWYVNNANTDLPEGTNGFLLVLPYWTGTTTWGKQIFIRFGTPGSNDGNIYIRGSNNGGTSWGAWWKFTGASVN